MTATEELIPISVSILARCHYNLYQRLIMCQGFASSVWNDLKFKGTVMTTLVVKIQSIQFKRLNDENLNMEGLLLC